MRQVHEGVARFDLHHLAPMDRLTALVQVYGSILQRYHPEPWPGRIMLFYPVGSQPDPADPSRGWLGLAGNGVELHNLPGEYH
jgi:hypothetical protein